MNKHRNIDIPSPADGEEIERASLRVSYWSIVGGQLRKDRLAVFGIWCIAALFLLAVYAPLLALDKPFYFIAPKTGETGGGVEFPFFACLFNRLFFENGVDIFFNLIMVLSPLYLAFYLWARRQRGFGWLRSCRSILECLFVFHFVLFALLGSRTYFGHRNPLYRMAPEADYKSRVAALQAQDAAVQYLFPPYPQNYRSTDPVKSVKPPSRDNWFGTDREGRDVLARVLYGTRISLTIGVVAVSIYVVIGVILGALAGYFGGWTDMLISRLIEIMICFPTFFLILMLAAFIEERSIFHVMAIIGVTSWTGVARLVRGEFLKQKSLEYVQAAIALGIPKGRIIFRHILPNAIAPVLVAATFGVASAILVESSLSFLGLGDVSAPSWGALLNTGRLERKLWLILVPGFPIFFVVSVFNLVGEGLRDALDPKLRK